MQDKTKQSGNVFIALFGMVAFIGLLGAGLTTFVKGPLQSSISITRQSAAESQMEIASQLSVSEAISGPGSGDCDADGMIEPLEFRDAGALPKPTGGGLVPLSIGINKIDPWGTELGYCVWDHGTVTLLSLIHI